MYLLIFHNFANSKNKRIMKYRLFTVFVMAVACLTACGNSSKNNLQEEEEYKNLNTPMFPARNEGLYGYIDNKGNVVLDFQYLRADGFGDNDTACVQLDESTIGYINKDGKILLSMPKDKYKTYGKFYNGLAAVTPQNPARPWPIETGFINIHGEEVIPIGKYHSISNFKGGYAHVVVDKKYGYIDSKENFIVNPIYDNVSYNFHDGMASVRIGEKWGFINTRGEEVIPPAYEKVSDFNEGYAGAEKNGKWGIIDKMGNVIVPFKYGQILGVSEGLFVCEKADVSWVGENWGKYGVFDLKGNMIRDYEEHRITTYREGLALIEFGEVGNRKYGYIDTNGKIVIPPTFDFAVNFMDGLASVKKDGDECYIDKDGNIIWRNR